jgi:hypothetical protein
MGMRDERDGHGRLDCLSSAFYSLDSFLIKYLGNDLFKLRIVFTLDIPATRS